MNADKLAALRIQDDSLRDTHVRDWRQLMAATGQCLVNTGIQTRFNPHRVGKPLLMDSRLRQGVREWKPQI